MELYLKRYFWTAWLAFLAVAATLTARVVTLFVGASLEPTPVLVTEPAMRRPLPVASAGPSLDVAEFGHLFGIDPPPPAERTEEASAGPMGDVCYTCAPVKTGLRLQLIGAAVATERRYSMAVIHDLDRQVSEVYVTGETIKHKKAVVYDVVREPQRVIIINEETQRLEYIDGVPGSGQQVTMAGLGSLGTSPVPSPDGAGEDGGGNVEGGPVDGVRQVSENDYAITQERLNTTLSNLNMVATQARIVPSFKNGTANGFKLFSIRPGSIYSAIGIQNGDVITRINGFEINSPDKALEIYQRLRDARNVEIDVERRGQMLKKRYTIE